MKNKIIALAGNPNVGKSTLFNRLTGMHQHTGNWSGKTVSYAKGKKIYKNTELEFVDLPGMYSMSSDSPDEKAAAEYIKSQKFDLVLIVADATCLERNLLIILDILNYTKNVILCVNLIDEASRKGIIINTVKLSHLLKIPVFPVSARNGHGIETLLDALSTFHPHVSSTCDILSPSEIFSQCVTYRNSEPSSIDIGFDRFATSKLYGFPIMFLLLLLVFWLTMVGANYPSAILSWTFDIIEEKVHILLELVNTDKKLASFFIDGIYKTLTWVISVMLPPIAIFFPLFALLEDSGYLPRVAFNMDNMFRKCGAHGKQSLTMCMGFGCNACGIMGCRIIESPRERLIAILTNVFVPCNGRFPTLIAIILMFMISGSGILSSLAAGSILSLFIISGFLCTFIISKILSSTILNGIPSTFVLELPQYRRPQFMKVIMDSIRSRIIFVLGRAVAVSIPAGIIIWCLANISIENNSLLFYLTEFLDPFGQLIGVDGVIITAFILGFPANEIVIPVMLMCYLSTNTLTDYHSLYQLHDIFTSCGWTLQTAVSVMILCMFHFPCGTTCLTIKKETGSLKWTALAIILPTLTGVVLCLLLNIILPAF